MLTSKFLHVTEDWQKKITLLHFFSDLEIKLEIKCQFNSCIPVILNYHAAETPKSHWDWHKNIFNVILNKLVQENELDFEYLQLIVSHFFVFVYY